MAQIHNITTKSAQQKKTPAKRKRGKQKNKIVALLLCIFFGYFGFHKFYEGKTKLGIIYLFTFGLFCFGWIIDIIIIALKPNPYYV